MTVVPVTSADPPGVELARFAAPCSDEHPGPRAPRHPRDAPGHRRKAMTVMDRVAPKGDMSPSRPVHGMGRIGADPDRAPTRVCAGIEACPARGIPAIDHGGFAAEAIPGRAPRAGPGPRERTRIATTCGIVAPTGRHAALAFLLRHPARILPVPGTNSLARIGRIADAGRVEPSRAPWFQLREAALGQEVP